MNASQRGFTLIELLIVITIIGILMGLLVPGVNLLREQSRQTTCMNNHKQVAAAMLAYEASKKHLPPLLGQVQFAGGQVTGAYNWAEALFPYLDHNDMWTALCTSGSGSIATMRLNELVCPDDPYLANTSSPNAQALLSFAVNLTYFICYTTSNQPVDVSGTNPQPPANLSHLTTLPTPGYPAGQPVSLADTAMVGEFYGDSIAGDLPRYYAGFPQKWTAQGWAYNPGTFLGITGLTFFWTPHMGNPQKISGWLGGAHPGKVVVAFFDGHVEKLDKDTLFPR